VSHETLRAYHRYLARPHEVPLLRPLRHRAGRPLLPQVATITVTGLLEPEDDRLTEEAGLICTARDRDEEIEIPLREIVVKRKGPKLQAGFRLFLLVP